MGNKWNEFLEWIKWNEWKTILSKFFKWTKKFLKSFIEWVKWIFNEFGAYIKLICTQIIKFIRWIIFPIAIITLIVTLVVAFQKFTDGSGQIHTLTKDIEVKMPSISQPDISKNMMKILDLKRNVFDSNTITFLVSFVLVFLGTIWLSNEMRVKKHIKKADKNIKQVEVERNTMLLQSKILALQVLSLNCQNAVSSNMGGTNDMLYRTHRMASNLLREFSEGNHTVITEKWKSAFCEIFTNMINDFGMETINEETPEDNPRIRFQRSINETIGILEELHREISRLREV